MTTPGYVSVPIETDPAELTQDVFDYLQSYVSTWVPADGNLDVRIISAIAQMAAESRDVASDVPTSIFRYFGSELINLPPIDAVGATFSATFTAFNTLGHTIPAGTTVQGTDTGGNVTYWTTVSDAVIPGGSNSIAGVNLLAQLSGTSSNNFTFTSGQLTLVDSLAYIATVTATSTSSGGVDAEDDDTYLNRLRQELTLLTPRPIIPSDFATIALNFPGVNRAVAIDGYNLPAKSTPNAATITVYVMASDGSTPSTGTLTAIQNQLLSQREVNWNIYVSGPVSVSVRVDYNVIALIGVDKVALKTAIQAALAFYLSPAQWGSDPSGVSTAWTNKQSLRLSEVSAVIQGVTGVDYVQTLTLNTVAANLDLTAAGANGPVVYPVFNAATSVGTVS